MILDYFSSAYNLRRPFGVLGRVLWPLYAVAPLFLLAFTPSVSDIPYLYHISICTAGILLAATALLPISWPRKARVVLLGLAGLFTPYYALELGNWYVGKAYFRTEWLARQQCAGHLRSIGMQLGNYTFGHAGRYPATFHELDISMSEADLICSHRWSDAIGKSEEELVGSLDDAMCPYGSYVYVGGCLTSSSPPSSVVIYEKLQNHGDGINVLHLDGSVTWLNKADAEKLIAGYANYKPHSTQPTPQP